MEPHRHVHRSRFGFWVIHLPRVGVLCSFAEADGGLGELSIADKYSQENMSASHVPVT